MTQKTARELASLVVDRIHYWGSKAEPKEWVEQAILQYSSSLQTRLREVEAENERLRKFADHILQNYSWDNCCAEIDPADAQDKAEELGLIEKRDVNPNDYDGADWAFFTKWTPKEAK